MPNTIGHFLIGARDQQKAAEFYSKLFGWEITPQMTPDGENHRIDTGGKIAGHIVPSEGAGYTGFMVMVEDLEKALQRATELGGNIVAAPQVSLRGARFALFSDPEGTIIGLIERKNRSEEL